MKIDSNILASHQRGSFPGFCHVSSSTFIFAPPSFPVTPRHLRPPGSPHLPGSQTLTIRNSSVLSTNEGGKQLNYSDDPGPGLAFLCLGRTGLAAGLLAAAGSRRLDVRRALVHPRVVRKIRSLLCPAATNPRSKTLTIPHYVWL